MISRSALQMVFAAVAAAALCIAAGCQTHWKDFYQRPSAQPLGTLIDPVWRNQEINAERSDFVVHEHEFAANSEILNTAGEDHVKQIAARLAAGHDAQVLIERGRSSARPDTKYQYRVHPDPELDLRRREIVVRSLLAMGISDADVRTLVAPALAPEYRAGEAATLYNVDAISPMGGIGGFGGFGGGVQGGAFVR